MGLKKNQLQENNSKKLKSIDLTHKTHNSSHEIGIALLKVNRNKLNSSIPNKSNVKGQN